MSFRSVSALPTCLHTRLAFRQTVRFGGLARHQRCRNHSASTAFDCGNNSGTPSLISSHLHKFTSGSETEKCSDAASTAGLDAPGFKANLDVSQHDEELVTHSESKARTATTFSATGSVHKSREVISSNGVGREAKPSTESATTERTTYGYNEWEELHDKFVETRRTCPDRMKQMFSQEASVARSFLGADKLNQASTPEFKRKWLALTDGEQYTLLPILLIGSLVESAAAGLFILRNVKSMACSSLIRMNCLRHIGMIYRRDLLQDRELRCIYEEQIGLLRSPESWPRGRLSPVLLQNLLFWSTHEQCSEIIRGFLQRNPSVEPSSLVAIIEYYIRIKDPETALKYLKRLPEDLLRQPDTNVQAVRDRLIKLDVVAKIDGGTNFKYLPQLLALGLPSDESLHNAVIESAISNGLPDVAWDLYRYLETSTFEINARSHLVLLRDAFYKSELQRVNEIMTAIHNHENLISDQYLMAFSMNIVRNISYYEKQLGPKEACAHIMALYDRAYDRAPLIRLGLVEPNDEDFDKPQPSPTLLAFTIWTLTLVQRRDPPVIRLWGWIQSLIDTHDMAVLEAARHDILYNAVVLFHARKPSSLFRALEVVQYMLSSKICLPTSRTWSILLCAFLKHGQVQQAQRIITLMQSKGFDVQEVHEQYGAYVPMGYDLTSLANTVKQNLDDRDMPASMEELLADSKSLQREESSGTYS